MALVDAVYKFNWVDNGANDASIFNQSELKEVFEKGTTGFPAADPLPNDGPMPYLSEIFPLRTWLMKTFSGRNLPDTEQILQLKAIQR